MSWKRLEQMDLDGKNVLVRVDVNVPVQNGVVSDRTRLTRIKPTVDDILSMGGKPVLISHFGRPADAPDQNFSLIQVVAALSEELGREVKFASDCIGPVAQEAVDALDSGDVLLLENTRFHKGEKKNEPAFVKALAALGDVFVSDAFSAAHRAHGSVAGIAELLPSAAGRLMEAELGSLERALATPERPVLALVGGAKVSTKLELLDNLIDPMDVIVIGGGMANTFLAAQGLAVGKSLCEHDLVDTAKEIMAKAKASNCELMLPVDIVVAKEFAAHAAHDILPADQCPEDGMILDAGPQTIAAISEKFETMRTVIWNGPLGAFEIEPFNTATDAAATKVAELTRDGTLVSVAGGGDTVAALNQSGAAESFSYISTAGGAFLEWMEGKTLPGVAALEKG